MTYRLFKCKSSALLKLVVMTVSTWVLFALILNLSENILPLIPWSFVTLASVFTLLALNLLGFFTYDQLANRKIGLLLFPATVSLGGIFSRISLLNVSGSAPYKSIEILLLGTIVSTVVFLSFYTVSQVLSRKGEKKKVVLDLSASDRKTIQDLFEEHDMDSFLEFITRKEFEKISAESTLNEVDLIIISRKSVNRFEEDGLLIRAHLCGIPIMDKKKVIESLSGRVFLKESDLWSYVLFAKKQTASIRFYDFIKSLIEPPVALLLLLAFSPIMILISILIKLTSSGAVLYLQRRTGYLGQEFNLYKFRSMVVDSEKDGPRWASENDSRVTRFGYILRKCRLDELPQLINVIRGEMSFIGPRPERPEIYEKLKEQIPLFSMRTIVTPGITGWAQVSAGYAASVSESFDKLEYDLFYIQNMSPSFDFMILLKTIKVALMGSEFKKDKRRFDNELLFRASSIFAISILILLLNASIKKAIQSKNDVKSKNQQELKSKEVENKTRSNRNESVTS